MVEIFERPNNHLHRDARSEVMKVLQAKAYDEQQVQTGAVPEFYANVSESDNEAAKRIERLYRSWTNDERSTFSVSPSSLSERNPLPLG